MTWERPLEKKGKKDKKKKKNLVSLAFLSRSSLKQLLLLCSTGDFPFPSFLLHLLSGILLKGRVVLFLYNISVSSWSFIYSLGYNPILLGFCCCSNFSSCGHWESFKLAAVSIWHALISSFSYFLLSFLLSTSSFFSATECSRLILCFSCFSPGINHFTGESFCFLLKNSI